MENSFLKQGEHNHSIDSSQRESTPGSADREDRLSAKNAGNPFLSTFLTELVHSIKNTLISINNASHVSIDKLNDPDIRKVTQKSISEDIKKIDSVLNSLLNYIHINTPIIKSNTISLMLEEVLEANENPIQSKQIKIIKRYEEDLPEAYIHDEQLRFILNSVLQYAILSTPLHGTIAFIIKYHQPQTHPFDSLAGQEKESACIEMTVGFTSGPKLVYPSKDTPESPNAQEGEPSQLILHLVKDTLQKSRGRMVYEVDSKNSRAAVKLIFPVERRKVLYYEPIRTY